MEAAGEVSGEAMETPLSATHDFIVTELNYFPEGLVSAEDKVPNPCGLDTNTNNTTYEPLQLAGLAVDGFDLDGETSEGRGFARTTTLSALAARPGSTSRSCT